MKLVERLEGVPIWVMTLLLLCSIGCSVQGQHQLWQEIDAPSGTLRIEYDDPPAFGSHTLIFSYQYTESLEWQSLGRLEFDNDGANLGDHNLEILKQTPESMTFVLRGQQQQDQSVILRLVDGKAELISE